MSGRLAGQSWYQQTYPVAREGFHFRDDFFQTKTGGLDWQNFNAGTITYGAVVANNAPGVVTIAGAAVTPDGGVVFGAVSSIRMGGGELVCEWRAKMPILSDATNRFVVRIGLGDNVSGGDNTDGVYFECDLATHGDNEWRGCTANNAVRTKLDLNTLPVADTWQRLKFIVSADGTSVSFYIDDVYKGAVATNIPTARESGFCAMYLKTLGAVSRSVVLDYVDITQRFTVQR